VGTNLGQSSICLPWREVRDNEVCVCACVRVSVRGAFISRSRVPLQNLVTRSLLINLKPWQEEPRGLRVEPEPGQIVLDQLQWDNWEGSRRRATRRRVDSVLAHHKLLYCRFDFLHCLHSAMVNLAR
jgi:hypothetical protein